MFDINYFIFIAIPTLIISFLVQMYLRSTYNLSLIHI